MDKLKMHSPNLTQEHIARLRELFPGCVTEGRSEDGRARLAVDFDQLRQELSEFVVEGPQERYHLNWPGKREALLTANAPIAKTLRPCSAEGLNFDTTKNLLIEGDNLDALKLLLESYLGRVKVIYIDPPYNTGSDFIYDDDFSESAADFLLKSNQADSTGARLVANTEANGRFHSDWLSMMCPRLRLAKSFLQDDGVILVSIGDRELSNLIQMMSEIYGESSQVGIFTWKSRAKPTNAGNAKFRVQRVAEYVVAYATKPADQMLLNAISSKIRAYPHEDEDGSFRTTTILTSNRGMFRRETMRFESGGFIPDEDSRWKAGKTIIDALFARNRIAFNDDGIPVEKKYEHEERDPLYPIYSYVDTDLSGTAENGKSELNELIGNQHGLDTVKPVQLLKYLIATFSSAGDVVMDFFAGSGTTAQAVFELDLESESNRRLILCQIPEAIDGGAYTNIADITKERLRKSGEKVLRLAKESQRQAAPDVGFRVFKVDTSNMADVYYAPDALDKGQIDLLIDNIKPGRTAEDLLFQVMLDWGLDLALPIEKKMLQGKEVFFVDGDALAACFDAHGDIDGAFVKELAKFKPLRVVFHDAGFKDSAVKINVEQIFKLLSPATEVKCI